MVTTRKRKYKVSDDACTNVTNKKIRTGTRNRKKEVKKNGKNYINFDFTSFYAIFIAYI